MAPHYLLRFSASFHIKFCALNVVSLHQITVGFFTSGHLSVRLWAIDLMYFWLITSHRLNVTLILLWFLRSSLLLRRFLTETCKIQGFNASKITGL